MARAKLSVMQNEDKKTVEKIFFSKKYVSC